MSSNIFVKPPQHVEERKREETTLSKRFSLFAWEAWKIGNNLVKIGLRRRDHTTSTHHRLSNESSNLDIQKAHEWNLDILASYKLWWQVIFTVSGPSLRIRSSKFLASLIENSSSVSPVSHIKKKY
jgi:hypothetical protein